MSMFSYFNIKYKHRTQSKEKKENLTYSNEQSRANFNNVISEDRRNPTRAVMIISLDFQDIVKGAFFHVTLGFASDESKSDFIGLTESESEYHGSERF